MIGKLSLLTKLSLDIFNKFSAISSEEIDSDNIESVYECLVKSTEEIAISTLKKSWAHTKPGNSNRVVKARTSLKTISEKYHKSQSQSKKIQLIVAKKKLDGAYLDS